MRRRHAVLALVLVACDGSSGQDASEEPDSALVTTGGVGGASSSGGATGAGGATSAGAGGAPSSSDGSAGSADGGTSGNDGSTLRPGARPFDWVGIIGTGQSLSVGWDSLAVSTAPSFNNIALEDRGPDPKYPIGGSGSPMWAIVPLKEPLRKAVAGSGPGYDNLEYPNNIANQHDVYGETPHSGMASTLSMLWRANGGDGDYVTAHTTVGVAAAAIGIIDKQGGRRSFPAALSEITAFKGLAAAKGKSYGVAGIILTHGESDANNPVYGDAVYRLWQDYNTGIKAITGQRIDVVLLASQQSASAGYDNSAVQIWKAGRDHPGQIVCTGPKYQYRPYGLHLPAAGYERLGEKYAEVFDLVVNQGVPWKPLGPNHVSRKGPVITVDLDVPNPPLRWDDHLAPPHQTRHAAWANGRGFEVKDNAGNELAIKSVEIVGNSVVLTLAVDPVNASLTLGYALTADTDAPWSGGEDLGPHGQLRDSDEFVGYDVQSISAKVVKGSVDISSVTSGALARRTGGDIVTADGLPQNTAVSRLNNDQLTLSAPWSGATGTAALAFRHDHHNYCVHFNLPVP